MGQVIPLAPYARSNDYTPYTFGDTMLKPIQSFSLDTRYDACNTIVEALLTKLPMPREDRVKLAITLLGHDPRNDSYSTREPN